MHGHTLFDLLDQPILNAQLIDDENMAIINVATKEANVAFQQINQHLTYCLHEFTRYADAYITFVQSLSTPERLFGKHGSPGIERARNSKRVFLDDARTALSQSINQKLRDICANQKPFNMRCLHDLFVIMVYELIEQVKRHCVNIQGGKLHPHSYKSYLLGYLSRLEFAASQALNATKAESYNSFPFKTLMPNNELYYTGDDRDKEYAKIVTEVNNGTLIQIKPVF